MFGHSNACAEVINLGLIADPSCRAFAMPFAEQFDTLIDLASDDDAIDNAIGPARKSVTYVPVNANFADARLPLQGQQERRSFINETAVNRRLRGIEFECGIDREGYLLLFRLVPKSPTDCDIRIPNAVYRRLTVGVKQNPRHLDP